MKFSETDRQIFKYHDWNGEALFADPAKVLRKYREYTAGQYNELVVQMVDKDQITASRAIEALVSATAYSFEINNLFNRETGEGWTEIQLTKLMDSFNKWCNALGKDTPG